MSVISFLKSLKVEVIYIYRIKKVSIKGIHLL